MDKEKARPPKNLWIFRATAGTGIHKRLFPREGFGPTRGAEIADLRPVPGEIQRVLPGSE